MNVSWNWITAVCLVHALAYLVALPVSVNLDLREMACIPFHTQTYQSVTESWTTVPHMQAALILLVVSFAPSCNPGFTGDGVN